MLLKSYSRLCFVPMDNSFTPAPSKSPFLPFISKSLPPTDYSLLSPGVCGHLHLGVVYLPQAQHVNQIHYLSFPLLPAPCFPNPLFFRLPYLGKRYHHYTLVTQTEGNIILNSSPTCTQSPNPVAWYFFICPIISSAATILVQAAYILHLDYCSIFQLLSLRPPEVSSQALTLWVLLAASHATLSLSSAYLLLLSIPQSLPPTNIPSSVFTLYVVFLIKEKKSPCEQPSEHCHHHHHHHHHYNYWKWSFEHVYQPSEFPLSPWMKVDF